MYFVRFLKKVIIPNIDRGIRLVLVLDLGLVVQVVKELVRVLSVNTWIVKDQLVCNAFVFYFLLSVFGFPSGCKLCCM